MIRINVSRADATLTETETLTEGRVGLRCAFTFGEEWNGLQKIAYFEGSDARSVAMVDGDEVEVPWECLASAGYKLNVGVRGDNANGDTVIPTVWVRAGKIVPSPDSGIPEGEEPTPSVVAQIQQAAANALLIASGVREDADSGAFVGPAGPAGPTGPTGDSGVYIGTTPPTDPDATVWIDPNGPSYTPGAIDEELSSASENPVQNKVITAALATKADQASVESTIPPIVNTWLSNNIAQETGYALDASLTIGDAAAPADKVGEIKSAIERDGSIISANLMGIDVQQNLYPGAADWSGTWLASDSVNIGISTVLYDGYLTVYSSQAWRRWFKEIQIEAGKTYTFECMFRHANAGAAFLYLKDTSNVPITNPATISQNFAQFNGTPANTWVKLSVTFTCTASGGITPWAYSGSGAFYIAKYTLVEGDKAFSLSDALETAATKQEISAVGDYQKYTLSLGTSTGEYWNTYIAKNISAGDKIRLVFDYYSGNSALNWVKIAGQKSDQTWDDTVVQISNPEHGSSAEAFAANNYVRLRIQFARATDESNVSGAVLIATNQGLGITNELLSMHSRNVYHVEKDGSGDFTSLVEAVNTACQSMDSIVYVGAGAWDIVSELGTTYINSVSSTQRGLYLKNRVHVICSSEALITCNYTGTREDTITWLSAFNAGEYGFTLENARIESSKCRYSIHDERDTSEDQYTNRYLNCNIKHDNTSGGYVQCIGGGLGKDGHIVISGCIFENPHASNVDIVSYHNTWYAGGTGKSNVEVTGCYFKGTTTFRASWFGASQEISEFLVHDNSIGYPVIHRVESQSMMDDNPSWIKNTELLEWNNVVRA